MRKTSIPAAVLILVAPVWATAQHTLVSDGANRTVDVWAAKGMMESPVSICLDPQGNLYVAETDRAGNAVTDTRNIMRLHAVEDDLQFKSIEDRRAQIHRWIAAGEFPPDFFTKTEDRVRVLSDTNGDGTADAAKVFAAGFNDELDGIGAGLLWLNNTIYYTCIPHLWALPDANHDLVADSRQSLAEGFGVRWCFYGHDLHGLAPGPDGRIYFSMGDRGFNVTTKEGVHLVGVDRGGVFRCWPDGSGLELYYQGLRNPQELAFSELGDLFTGDNNCDSGDRARIVNIVEGGDSGWRQDVQSLEGTDWGETSDIHSFDSRGPWNREFMWHTLADSSGPARPAWALPPVEYMTSGPSGLALYPGTGESHAYDGCFFLCDFRGGDAVVHAFRCIPEGAFFKVADHVEYYRGATITDIAWGYDGRLYMSDWGGGWAPNPNGVILTVTNRTVHDDPTEAAAINEVQNLFRQGFTDRPVNELLKLLGHRDQRVRLAAQYALADRGLAAGELASIAGDAHMPVTTRAHAIWALGQEARKKPAVLPLLARLTGDPDAEVRTQAIRTLGDIPSDLAGSTFNGFLIDPAPRVQLAAAIALAHHGDGTSVAPLLDLLDANNNADLTLRHGAAFALSRVGKPGDVAMRARDRSPAVRLGVVLALRLMEAAEVSEFLKDADPAVAIEAARAVYDLRIQAGLPMLAAMLDSDIPDDRAIEPLMRRAIEANVLLGAPESAAVLADFAARPDAGAKWRLLAMERLLNWDQPLQREGVWGNWADLPGRPAGDVEGAVRPRIEAMLAAAEGDDQLLGAAYRLRARHALHLSVPEMAALSMDASHPAVERLAVLDQLTQMSSDAALLSTTARAIVDDESAAGPLRQRAMDVFAAHNPDGAVEILHNAAMTGPIADRQHAIRTLGKIKGDAAAAVLAAFANDLSLGWADHEVALDIYETCMALPDESSAHQSAKKAGIQPPRPDGFATNLLIAGGDPVNGRTLFLHKSSSECIRCHTTEGTPKETAPSLRDVGARLTPELLVQSVTEPGVVVAAGFGKVSAMPEMTRFLNPREVRDIVAYLQTLRGAKPAAAQARTPQPSHADTLKQAAEPDGGASRVAVFALAAILAAVLWRSLTRRA